MAKATATCTCATCGATFTRTKICRNRREADGWEAWAAANFDECDVCYTARKASEREAAAAAEAELPLALHMTGYPYKDNTPVVLFFGGDTMPRKDDIKALGAVIDDSIVDTEYLAKQAAAKHERVAAAEASGITEPVKPVCYPAGRWNGKVYGTAAYGYRIYVDNAEVQISGDDADALKNYAKALAAWREATK
nr:MAG TPA: hypothetical protein [Caudoviricetes sp.]